MPAHITTQTRKAAAQVRPQPRVPKARKYRPVRSKVHTSNDILVGTSKKKHHGLLTIHVRTVHTLPPSLPTIPMMISMRLLHHRLIYIRTLRSSLPRPSILCTLTYNPGRRPDRARLPGARPRELCLSHTHTHTLCGLYVPTSTLNLGPVRAQGSTEQEQREEEEEEENSESATLGVAGPCSGWRCVH